MKPIEPARVSKVFDHVSSLRTKRLLLPVTALFLISSVRSSFGQTDPTQLLDRSSPRSHTVSRNQLLAPGKALRAVERAQKDIADGHLESAQKEIARALDIAPHYAVAKAVQGGIYLETGNYEGGAKSFQAAMDDDPASGAAYVGMAVVLIHQKRFQAALPLLDRAERLLPGAWFVHFARAWAHLELGNTEAALKQADCAEQIAGTNSEMRSGISYLRAMVSIHMSDADTARRYLAEAVTRDPGGNYAALAKKEIERLQPLLAARR